MKQEEEVEVKKKQDEENQLERREDGNYTSRLKKEEKVIIK